MENHEHLRVKSPMSTEFIQHKMVRATFTRDNGLTKESGIGEIMVSENSEGLSLVWIQFLTDSFNNSVSYIKIYLDKKGIESLKKVDSQKYDFEINSLIYSSD